MTAENAVEKFANALDKARKPTSWDLALEDIGSLQPGCLVLADTTIGTVTECSMGIVVQRLETNLIQVVFQQKSGGATECIIVPLEALCIRGSASANDDDYWDSD